MEDDIDIEEHDLLENPTIRNIFPDLSVIKQEIKRFEEGFDLDKDSPSVCYGDNKNTNDGCTFETEVVIENLSEPYEETSSSEDSEYDLDSFDPRFNSNIIILGSKANKQSNYDEFVKHEVISSKIKLVLDDMQPYLNSCGRFCKKCLILFPSNEEFTEHLNSIHMNDSKETTLKESNECEHLYGVLQSKSEMKFPKSHKNGSDEQDSSYDLLKQLNVAENSNKKKEFLYYRCHICASYFRRFIYFTEHMVKKHDCLPNTKNKVKFDPLCPWCFQNYMDVQTYNAHIISSHRSQLWARTPSMHFKKVLQKNNIKEQKTTASQRDNYTASQKETNISSQKEKNIASHKEKSSDENVYHMCHICSYYFTNYQIYKLHMMNRHHSFSEQISPKVKFAPICKWCSQKTKSARSYNCHLRAQHQELFTFKSVMIQPNPGSSSNKTSKSVEDNLYYKCHICTCYLETFIGYKRHIKNQHNSLPRPMEKVKFNPMCKWCPYEAQNVKSLYFHLFYRHKSLMQTKETKTGQSKNVYKKTSHSPKTINVTQNKKSITTGDEVYYKCQICSMYFTTYEVYCSHVSTKHCTNPINTEKVKYDSKCQWCTKTGFSSFKSYNSHIYCCHRSKVTAINCINNADASISQKNPSTPVNKDLILKSTLFKCTKCDIHFLSAKVCVNHTNHMEMLINWKCSTCLRIFKQEDALLHEKQHIQAQNFTVHELCPVPLHRVLFKCSMCTIHFPEDNFFQHYVMCEKTISKSVYCKNCDILIADFIEQSHITSHIYEKLKPFDFTTVEADVINISCQNIEEIPKANDQLMKSQKGHDTNQRNENIEETSKAAEELSKRKLKKTNISSKNFEKTSTAADQSIKRKPHETNISSKNIEKTAAATDSSIKRKSPETNTSGEIIEETSKVYDQSIKRNGHESNISNQNIEKETKQSVKRKSQEKCNDIHHKRIKLLVHDTDDNISINSPQTLPYKCKLCNTGFASDIAVLTHKCRHTKEYPTDQSESLLHECKLCNIHFTSNIAVLTHKCSDIDYLMCQRCDIKLSEGAFKIHMLHHISANVEVLSKDNTITHGQSRLAEPTSKRTNGNVHNNDILQPIEPDVDSNNIETFFEEEIQSDSETDEIEYDKKLKLECRVILTRIDNEKTLKQLLNLLYCGNCKLFVSNSKSNKPRHVNEQCVSNRRCVCDICGLVFGTRTYNSHMKIHSLKKDMSVKDFTIYDIKTDIKINCPIPEYLKCKTCDIFFVTTLAAKRHICGETKFIPCNICQKKFTNRALELHTVFHTYFEDSNVTSASGYNAHDSSAFEPESDLEILYNCRNCYVAMDTYDKVIEHCQKHYSNNDAKINTITCTDCDLNLDETCYENHKKIHLSNKDGKKFTVLNFDSMFLTLESHDWIRHVFGKLPQKQIDKILSESIYKHECRIKMEIVQDGIPDLTVYLCDKCRSFVDETQIYKHADNSCFKLRKHPCGFCGLAFISSVVRMKHEKIHLTAMSEHASRLESYRIVTFNKEEHQSLNRALYNRGQYNYVLYQCRSCGGVVDRPQMKHHECKKELLKKCSSCGLLFSNDDNYQLHYLRHQKLKNFSETNFKVILFGPDGNYTDSLKDISAFKGLYYDYTLYNCINCQICVKSKQCTSSHSCSFGTGRLQCPHCKLYFSNGKLKLHIRLHERDPDFTRENIRLNTFIPPSSVKDLETPNREAVPRVTIESPAVDKIPKPKIYSKNTLCRGNGTENYKTQIEEKIGKLYKCICGLHFLDQLSIISHNQHCNPRIRVSTQVCSKCGLIFTPNILFNHLLMHHGNKKQIFKFDVIDMQSECIVYQCRKCNCHFGKDTKINDHIKSCNGNTVGNKCDSCKLQFIDSYYPLHECTKSTNSPTRSLEVIKFNETTVPNIPLPVEDNSKDKILRELDLKNYTQEIFKCLECGVHYLTKKSIRAHLKEKHSALSQLQDICNICGLNFASAALKKHVQIHHEILNITFKELTVVECNDAMLLE